MYCKEMYDLLPFMAQKIPVQLPVLLPRMSCFYVSNSFCGKWAIIYSSVKFFSFDKLNIGDTKIF